MTNALPEAFELGDLEMTIEAEGRVYRQDGLKMLPDQVLRRERIGPPDVVAFVVRGRNKGIRPCNAY